jgi:aminoglycoside phosphotransferase
LRLKIRDRSFVLLHYLSQNWERLGLPSAAAAQHITFAAATPRFRTSAHVVFFLFLGGELRLVTKVSRLPGEDVHLLREARILTDLAQTDAQNVPRLIAMDQIYDRPLLVETALPGRAISRAMVLADPEKFLERGLDWLCSLHAATAQPSAGAEIRRLSESSLLLLRDRMELTREEVRILARTSAILESLPERCPWLVFEHGDFSAPNLLLLPNGELGVVDWELATQRGIPGADLFFFLTFIAFARERADSLPRQLRAFRNAFHGNQAWAARYIERYAVALGLPRDVLPPLFVLTWLRYVGGLIARLSAGEDGGRRRLRSATTAWLRQNRYFQLWLQSVGSFQELHLTP